MSIVTKIVFFCLLTSSAFALERNSLEEKALFAPRIFPQLYKCITVPKQNQTFEKRSQSNEDVWLDEHIFSKLPKNELYGGTFIEMGALDGLFLSNSYYFEKKYDWRGLLVEGQPLNQLALKNNEHIRSNCAIFNTAICNYRSDGDINTVTFTADGGAIGTTLNSTNEKFLSKWHRDYKKQKHIVEHCVPLQPILEVTGFLDIDLFSLDVEGAELLILQTLNFEVLNFRVIVVENDGNDKVKDQGVRNLLLGNGYKSTNDTIGDIQSACHTVGACMQNEAFINPNFLKRKTARAANHRFPRYYEFGTGMACAKHIRDEN
jgi:FkbM family methyltransferase